MIIFLSLIIQFREREEERGEKKSAIKKMVEFNQSFTRKECSYARDDHEFNFNFHRFARRKRGRERVVFIHDPPFEREEDVGICVVTRPRYVSHPCHEGIVKQLPRSLRP